MDMTVAHVVITVEFVLIHTATGITAAAEREPADAWLLDRAISRNASKAARHATGESTRKQPNAVATPFPPFLNFM